MDIMTLLQRLVRQIRNREYYLKALSDHVLPQRDLTRYRDLIHAEYASLDQFLESDHTQEVSSIRYGDVHMDLLIEDRNCETTVVVFHTALDPEGITTPVFVGRGLLKGLNANVICCSDPALELGVGLGWFIGKQGQEFQDDLASAIRHILHSLRSHKYLVFYGPSGGGFASLYYSSRFPGSLAMPVNPQTDIDAYSKDAVKRYCRAAWGVESGADVPAVTDLRPEYSGALMNHVLYLQNLGDRAHVSKQLIPYLAAVSERHKVLLSFGKWGIGHRAPPPDVQRPFVEAAVEVRGDWEKLRKIIDISEESDPQRIKDLVTEYTLLEKRAMHRKSLG
ncbi:hypothetical protein ACTXJJ_09855 [Corynebacterium casei]